MKKYLYIILTILLSTFVISCANPNDRFFGSDRVKLDVAEFGSDGWSNLQYMNQEKGLLIKVIRRSMPNAKSHYEKQRDAMLKGEEEFRNAKLTLKYANNLPYYSVYDEKLAAKTIYVFDTNKNNDAFLMKVLFFPVDREPSNKVIQELHEFEVY